MKRIIAYIICLYVVTICAGIYLNNAHGEEGFPYEKHIDAPRAIQPALSCKQYLEICDSSCNHRGGMFRFVCLGKDFNPDLDRYRCQCGDEPKEVKQVAKTVPVK